MLKITKVRRKKIGLPPGSLVYTGEEKKEEVAISLIDYDETQFQEKEIKEVEACFPFKDSPTVTWINIDGIHNTEVIAKIGKHFALHPLVLEDICHTEQRPKMEDFGSYIYIVLKMLSYNQETHEVSMEQVSVILGENFVISFQEKKGDIFDYVRERIRKEKGRIRKMGADYLAYALLDAIVDNYFVINERIGDEIEILEQVLADRPTDETLREIHRLKRELIYIRKSVWPLREVVGNLKKGESDLIQNATQVFLGDVYDHTIQVIDTIETYRDMLSGVHDTYLTNLSNRMNEVMKVLTIIATIFIPLTFIAGLYGMNFKFMPELELRLGYFIILLIMVIVAAIMIVFFKRKKWF